MPKLLGVKFGYRVIQHFVAQPSKLLRGHITGYYSKPHNLFLFNNNNNDNNNNNNTIRAFLQYSNSSDFRETDIDRYAMLKQNNTIILIKWH